MIIVLGATLTLIEEFWTTNKVNNDQNDAQDIARHRDRPGCAAAPTRLAHPDQPELDRHRLELRPDVQDFRTLPAKGALLPEDGRSRIARRWQAVHADTGGRRRRVGRSARPGDDELSRANPVDRLGGGDGGRGPRREQGERT